MGHDTNGKTTGPADGWVLRVLAAPALCACLACLALSVDIATAEWSIHASRLDPLRPMLNAVEPFGNGFGVAVIVLAIFLLDPGRRRMLPRLLAASWGAGIVANLGKMLVVRARPYQWMSAGGGEGVFSTFGDWLPLGANRSIEQSFPSAHTATAFGLAVALCWLYPRGRWLFAALAVMVGMQRVIADVHFLSDVCAGAAVGWLVAMICLQGGWIARQFEKLEYRLGQTSGKQQTKVLPPNVTPPESGAGRGSSPPIWSASSPTRVEAAGQSPGTEAQRTSQTGE